MGFFEKKFVTRTSKYVINGKQYDSLEEIPAEYRAMFEDADGDGRPDFIQNAIPDGLFGGTSQSIEVSTVNGVTTWRVGDRRYGSLEEMPPEHRALFQDRDGDGLPDFLPNFSQMSLGTSLGAQVQAGGASEIDVEAAQPQSTPMSGRRSSSYEDTSPRQPSSLERPFQSDFAPPGESRNGPLLAIIFVLLTIISAGVVYLVLSFSGLL
jgi:hypothetical protein